MRVGLVVTPATTPIATALRISSTLAVSIKNFMLFVLSFWAVLDLPNFSAIMIAESAFLCNTWRYIRQISTINQNSRIKEDDMSISKRQEEILELLNEHNFLTVERLATLTYTSPSSIRRDLTHLQNLSLIKR
ncbi:MAG: DeoR family transcriptional regulator, partial [Clostridia bacterium]|nr:DeoR family transcriptional regulator [Clostridia bacterium]